MLYFYMSDCCRRISFSEFNCFFSKVEIDDRIEVFRFFKCYKLQFDLLFNSALTVLYHYFQLVSSF